MKTYLSLSAIALVAAFSGVSAQAQTATPLSRAQVQAELAQARADGSLQRLAFQGYGLPADALARPAPAAQAAEPAPAARGGASRAEVRAELQRARSAGELDFAAAEIGLAAPRQAAPVYAGDAVNTAGVAR